MDYKILYHRAKEIFNDGDPMDEIPLPQVRGTVKRNENGSVKIIIAPEEIEPMFTEYLPGSKTKVHDVVDLLRGDVIAPFDAIVYSVNNTDLILITEMTISHPSGLTIRYKRKIDADPKISLHGVYQVGERGIRKAFPLINLLNRGTQPRTSSKHTEAQKWQIVKRWEATGMQGNKEQDEFAEKYGITGRTLRNWIQKYG